MPNDKSTKIFIYDDLHPEDNAMLQALYSRSPASVVEHVEKVKEVGSGKFMSLYYVGYGHNSIGDCGSTTIYIENVSMLVAKAFQDNALYSGQEASTRYLDFAEQPLYDPYNSEKTMGIMQSWMDMYNYYMPMVKTSLAEKYPFSPAEYKNEKIWDNAVAARAFDTLRGFLPCGTTTLLSWSTNLRQARDKLMQLKVHPAQEVREVALAVFKQLREKYPNSFNGQEMDIESERYGERAKYAQQESMRDNYLSYQDVQDQMGFSAQDKSRFEAGEYIYHANKLDVAKFNRLESSTISSRPRGGAVNRRLQAYGSYDIAFTLDFGSFRDLQRHRNGINQVPLITGELGMYPWYMQQLQELLPNQFDEIKAKVDSLFDQVRNLPNPDVVKSQYLFPMGVSLPIYLNYSIPQCVYVAELRSGKPVHESLRPRAQQMAKMLKENHPDMALYADMDADSWTAKRGEQTISAKSA